ncbi:hypothetical protein M3Y97_00773200 [Aphelenchoides bicaudatus]|nr:hypothetical protein M3Y97_00773200 [Aphelenchoides bicaudatus]
MFFRCIRKQKRRSLSVQSFQSLSSVQLEHSESDLTEVDVIDEFQQVANFSNAVCSARLIESFNQEKDSLQDFYDQMAYESLLEFLLTIVTSVFGAFDFACRLFSLLWDIFRPVTNLTNLEGKNVLIVGGAGGVGSAVAKRLLKVGAKVALWDIDEKRLNSVQAELQDSGYKTTVKVVDIRNGKAVKAAGDELSQSFEVDILFNSAGVCNAGDSINDSDERLQELVDTNYLGVVYVTRYFWKKFIQTGRGHIVSMASVAGIAGVPHIVEYTGTLHGVVGYMDALEADTFARNIHGINFTVCNPPFIHTAMAHDLTTTGVPKYPWVDTEQCATEILRAISSQKRIHTFPWEANLFCSFKSILPRKRFNLLNGRFWTYD